MCILKRTESVACSRDPRGGDVAVERAISGGDIPGGSKGIAPGGTGSCGYSTRQSQDCCGIRFVGQGERAGQLQSIRTQARPIQQKQVRQANYSLFSGTHQRDSSPDDARICP